MHCFTNTVNEIKKYITNKDFIAIGELKGGTVEFIEFKIPENSPCLSKKLRDLKLPPACIVAAIVDELKAKVPNADDEIKAGDRIIVILEKDKRREVAQMFLP